VSSDSEQIFRSNNDSITRLVSENNEQGEKETYSSPLLTISTTLRTKLW
jgi:hypothetical protein